jgi:hypothetical protein
MKRSTCEEKRREGEESHFCHLNGMVAKQVDKSTGEGKDTNVESLVT